MRGEEGACEREGGKHVYHQQEKGRARAQKRGKGSSVNTREGRQGRARTHSARESEHWCGCKVRREREDSRKEMVN